MSFLNYFTSNIDALPKDIPKDVIQRLKGFVGLHSHTDIAEWHEFCQNYPHEAVHSMFMPLALKSHTKTLIPGLQRLVPSKEVPSVVSSISQSFPISYDHRQQEVDT
jgi:hypothetical protein